MREKFYRFMIGRNGMDELARTESFALWIPLVLTLVLRNSPISVSICNVIFWALLIHTYFRVFSRNLEKRREENRRFLNFRYDMAVKQDKRRRRARQKKNYCFFTCPMCKQEVRVPKGHGKIEITCPKCREKFVRRS